MRHTAGAGAGTTLARTQADVSIGADQTNEAA